MEHVTAKQEHKHQIHKPNSSTDVSAELGVEGICGHAVSSSLAVHVFTLPDQCVTYSVTTWRFVWHHIAYKVTEAGLMRN